MSQSSRRRYRRRARGACEPRGGAPPLLVPVRRHPRAKLKALLLATTLLTPGLVWAQVASNTLPSGANVASGQVTLSQSGSTLNVNQASSRAIINWQSFNIGSQAAVDFNQPSSSADRLEPRARRLDRADRRGTPRQRPDFPARSRGRDLRRGCQRECRRAGRLHDEHHGRELPRRQLRLPAQRLDRLGRQLRHAHGGLGRLHRASRSRGDQPGCDLGAARHGGAGGGRDSDARLQRPGPRRHRGRSGDGQGADREP